MKNFVEALILTVVILTPILSFGYLATENSKVQQGIKRLVK